MLNDALLSQLGIRLQGVAAGGLFPEKFPRNFQIKTFARKVDRGFGEKFRHNFPFYSKTFRDNSFLLQNFSP